VASARESVPRLQGREAAAEAQSHSHTNAATGPQVLLQRPRGGRGAATEQERRCVQRRGAGGRRAAEGRLVRR
jgi:hypothetical protein